MDILEKAIKQAKEINNLLVTMQGKKGRAKYVLWERIMMEHLPFLETYAESGMKEALEEDPNAATPPTIESMGHDIPPRQRG
ncbi:MAG: hypothetical protein Q7S52_02465 [bacterium]|nr:hypothetical protein [bacterium]